MLPTVWRQLTTLGTNSKRPITSNTCFGNNPHLLVGHVWLNPMRAGPASCHAALHHGKDETDKKLALYSTCRFVSFAPPRPAGAPRVSGPRGWHARTRSRAAPARECHAGEAPSALAIESKLHTVACTS